MRVMSFEDIKDINSIAYNFLISHNLKDLPFGRIDFGSGLYANVEEYDSMPRHKYEAHKKYLDIQIVITGKEKIIVRNIKDLKPISEYNPEKDFVNYENDNLGDEYLLNENDCLVLYPQDGHMPRVMVDNSIHIKKMVFKIPVDYGK